MQMIVLTPGNGVSFQRRTSTGGSSASTTVGGPAAPYWVRIVRTGNSFSGYRSSNGTNWTLVGTAAVTMASNVQVGLAVTSHNNSVSCTAKFTNVKILRHPRVAATAPTNGATNVFRNTAINADVTLPNAGAGVDDQHLEHKQRATLSHFGRCGCSRWRQYHRRRRRHRLSTERPARSFDRLHFQSYCCGKRSRRANVRYLHDDFHDGYRDQCCH